MPTGSDAPRWQLDSIYAGYDSSSYLGDRAELLKICSTVLKKLDDKSAKKKDPEKWLKWMLKKLDSAQGVYANLSGYLWCAYAVDTTNAATLAQIHSLEEDGLQLQEAKVRFRADLRSLRKQIARLAHKSKTIDRFSFFLNTELELADRQMTVAEENLAADLMRPGGDAWGRLQDTILSNLSWDWDGKERRTVVELRSMALNPDRSIRKKAFDLELAAWKSMEIPIAAALNGVKGFAVILDSRRRYESPLQHATIEARISELTLRSQIETMEANLPVFRTYLEAKAKLIGVEKLAFYDLFAPVGEIAKTWSFREARDFVIEQFSSFSWELGDFAEQAFREQWIDALPREGKTGGAFCETMPVAGQSRILANFDGSFDSLFTIAHELGHAYHGFVLKELPYLHQDYPMTLAETASIFCETIVFNQAIEKSKQKDRITVLEVFLQGATQVVVDILSRYKFELAVFERRKTGELLPNELCDLMRTAQTESYGDALGELHPYMWAAKPHYYSPQLSFYNFPYAFGLLFGLALYATYRDDVHEFPIRYRKLLQMTGQASANAVTSAAGFQIEDPAFWQSGLDVIAGWVSDFAALVEAQTAG